MDVERAMVAFLSGNVAVTALVGKHLYPLALPQGVALPALTYDLISDVPERDHEGRAGLSRGRVQLHAWAATKAAAVALALTVASALDGFRGLWAGLRIDSVEVMGRRAMYEPETQRYREVQDVLIWHEEVTG